MSRFDESISRTGTHSLKYDFAQKRGRPADILPLWVADMDFKAPDCVLQTLVERVQHGIFGYSDSADDAYFQALHNWYSSRFGWQPRPEWLVKTPGVVFALCTAIRAFTQPGDAVMIQQPVYYPFQESIVENDRQLVVSPLVLRDGKYHMDLENLEKNIVEHGVKLFLLCSPHNPVGRVWTKEELCALGDICVRHGVYVISDEIHADFVYAGHRHLVFAGLKPEFSKITITCTAPTKTFNLAGLQISNIFIEDARLRRKFRQEMGKAGYSQPNLMGLLACEAAYKEGAPWLEELLAYLTKNLAYVREFLSAQLPQIRLIEPEGTYLIWLDCRELGLSAKELEELIVKEAGLWLDEGPMFGAGGEGFQRINIACPRVTLQKAMEHLHRAVVAKAAGRV